MASYDTTIPVLVVGGGACGAIAALAAHAAGAEVALLEAEARPMGSSGMSQGLIAAAGTRAQAEAGIEDSPERFLADIMAKTRSLADPVIAHTLAHQSGPTLDWMVDHLDLPWTLDRTFRPSYGNSTWRIHGWAGHGGQDMVDLLHVRLAEAGIPVLTEARLAAVDADATGRIHGVTIERPGGATEAIGCGALILACGGFAANPAMIAAHIPAMATARNHGHEGSQGTALAIGEALGAASGDLGAFQGYPMLAEPHGVTVPPPLLVEGGVLVNTAGQRFADETHDIAGMVHAVLAQPPGPDGPHVWALHDARIAERLSPIPEYAQLVSLGAVRPVAATALPGPALAATLAEAQAAHAAGQPDAFGRSWTSPPPAGELLAIRVVGAIYHTQGGLQIDAQARVVRPDGTPLPNLLAGGGAARSVSGPSSWGYLPAMGLCTAVTLGRLAGESAARLAALRPA
jgi:fumarate reductase flavoprotein subunit